MKEKIGNHQIEIQDSGAPRGERNHWTVSLNGVELYADYNGKKANALYEDLKRALVKTVDPIAPQSRTELQAMEIKASQFVTGANERVLADDGQQGMRGQAGIGSTSERHQGHVAAAIFANCAHLDDRQLDEIIEWVRLYKN